MKIGLVSAHPFYFPGGVQEHIRGLYKYFKSRGHDVKIIIPKYKKTEKYGRDFILLGRAFRVPANATISNFSYLRNQEKIDKILKREMFDLIHFHNPGFFLGLHILRKSKAKNIFTAHFLPDSSFVYKIFKNALDGWVKKNVVGKFHGIICVSKPVLAHISKSFTCPRVVIPNGIDLNEYKPSKSKMQKFNDGKVNILFLGRIERNKGLEYLLRSYVTLKKKHPHIRLLIAGFGKEKNYKKLVKKLKLIDVEFIGTVKNKRKLKYFSTADIFCSPSLHESFGIVLLEAMACGKPIVAFDNKGYERILTGKGAKFLVKPKNIDELSEKLEILIRDKKLRESMGRWGLNHVKKYSWENVGKQIEDFYEEVLHDAKKGK